eukprot:CAMPEP_0170786180 /NCGR_PEP_ID=MMETSP0733-20121128/17421_1 /TAXON_ID=186038 /ORGANISM="Fragilariopsis kerguelensis, Strain L26-C5" /LENGTH=162 /DNA_ID=CAMNT_0011131921 /DNA_START=311 /DNA_END=796 /DNA_ORIENTATION=-
MTPQKKNNKTKASASVTKATTALTTTPTATAAAAKITTTTTTTNDDATDAPAFDPNRLLLSPLTAKRLDQDIDSYRRHGGREPESSALSTATATATAAKTSRATTKTTTTTTPRAVEAPISTPSIIGTLATSSSLLFSPLQVRNTTTTSNDIFHLNDIEEVE